MTSTSTVDHNVRDEIHRRIGRNLLTLQKIERAWKQLLIASGVEVALADGMAAMESRAAYVLRMNLGQLCEGLFAELFTVSPRERRPKADLSKGWVRTRVTFEPHPDAPLSHKALQERWRNLIGVRNQLVHHFFERWGSASAYQLPHALDELDRQDELAQVVLDEGIALLRQLDVVRREIAAQFNSPQGEREWLIGMSTAKIVERLWATAETKARRDGWTYETTALNALHEHSRDDVELLRETHGPNWLRTLLEAADGAFETMAEEVPNAHDPSQMRVLYRPRR